MHDGRRHPCCAHLNTLRAGARGSLQSSLLETSLYQRGLFFSALEPPSFINKRRSDMPRHLAFRGALPWIATTVRPCWRARVRRRSGCAFATQAHVGFVVALRRFRDESLRTSAPGRGFIRVYYSVSPALAHCFRWRTGWNSPARLVLDALVARLDDPARRT